MYIKYCTDDGHEFLSEAECYRYEHKLDAIADVVGFDPSGEIVNDIINRVDVVTYVFFKSQDGIDAFCQLLERNEYTTEGIDSAIPNTLYGLNLDYMLLPDESEEWFDMETVLKHYQNQLDTMKHDFTDMIMKVTMEGKNRVD